MPQNFGILTLATRKDYVKAIGLALSLMKSNPTVERAVACHPSIFPLLKDFYHYLIPEIAGLKGFAHKVYLDRYTPFKNTLFFDSDILVYRDVLTFIERWPKVPFSSCGIYVSDGFSSFGFDRRAIIKKLGKEKLVCIDGAGHSYFSLPDAVPVFERAREITNNYADYVGNIKYADEDVMNYVMTEMGIPPVQDIGDFFSRYCSIKSGTLNIDLNKPFCGFVEISSNRWFEPCMMHFAANEAPVSYFNFLRKMFKSNGVPVGQLFLPFYVDFFDTYIRPKIRFLKKLANSAVSRKPT